MEKRIYLIKEIDDIYNIYVGGGEEKKIKEEKNFIVRKWIIWLLKLSDLSMYLLSDIWIIS